MEEIHLLEMWINQWEKAEQQRPETADADEHEEDDDQQEADQSDQVDIDNDDVISQPAGHQQQVETKKKKEKEKKKKKKSKFGWKWPGSEKVSNPPLVTFLRPLLQEARQPTQMYPRRAQATAPMPENG